MDVQSETRPSRLTDGSERRRSRLASRSLSKKGDEGRLDGTGAWKIVEQIIEMGWVASGLPSQRTNPQQNHPDEPRYCFFTMIRTVTAHTTIGSRWTLLA
ncbi:hypothetical protein PGTUg99_015147 [Puccinia graminis f. sp. tritici]|uniref:Uncharacterized protein n=1 Tax=Puccinia graminis f. sp. tritici TaxID=56615 RepID=A0A5B0RBE6_PUCGR|nr:hypothetical protein PGTUg99_015147 [Puccinia graminis f. sp. tritici]